MDWLGVLYVIVTDTDEFPTWLPGTLPVWTSAELVAAFIADNDIDATPAELNEGHAVELLEELRDVGCTAVCVDPVTLDDDAATVPIQDVHLEACRGHRISSALTAAPRHT